MQILTIRGANLASLAGPFEIDLTKEPLRSAGLFAITGDTGAGKSTILDALCLALYGNCPRLAGVGVNDDVPDIDGETIKSSDPRAILRRGAAHGFAEVVFGAPDGKTYRASWTARRARGRAEGRLQSVERALIRVDDEALLETQVNAVKDRITEITGLTYDEFRRTVLLAQGDFDAFLRANTAERAALLEKVTGSAVYRDISRRVYALHENARVALETLNARRAATSALDDEVRDALGQEQQALSMRIAETTAAIAATAARIAVLDAVAAARGRVEQASLAHQAARQAVDAAGPDRQALERLETALGLKSEYTQLRAADRMLADRQAEETAALHHRHQLAARLQSATEDHREAALAHDAAESAFKAYGPDWTEATRLDGMIADAMAEADTATAQRDAMAQGQQQSAAALAELTAQEQTARDARDRALEQIASAPDTRLLADHWAAIDARLAERASARKSETAALSDARRARSEADQDKARREALTGADAANRASLERLEAAIAQAGASLEQIARDDPQARMDRLVTGAEGLRDMIRAAQAHDEARARAAEADKTIAHQTQRHRDAQDAHARARDEIARAAAAIGALQSPADRAEAAASDVAARLRQHLEPGAPCPVCGATRHPVAADDALIRLAQDLREELNGERRNHAEAGTARDDAARIMDAAQLALAGAQDASASARAAIAAAIAAHDTARAATVKSGLSDLPDHPADAVPALSAIASRLEARREEIAALIRRQADLRRQQQADRDAARAETAAITARAARHAELTQRIFGLESREALSLQAASTAAARIADIDREIAPALAAASLDGGALDADPDAVHAGLARRVAWWNAEVARRDAARSTLDDLAPRIASAQTVRDGTEANLRAAEETARARARRLGELVERRAGLLGGEETEPHRTRHNDTRLATAARKDKLAGDLSTIRSQAAAAEARVSAARAALDQARAAQQQARADLDTRLAAAGLDQAALGALLDQGVPAADRLRAALHQLDQALTGAHSTLRARQDDLRALLDTDDLPQEPEADLRARLEEHENARNALRERSGAIAQALASDDDIRQRLRGLDGDIAAARQICDTWAAVNEAVGSRQGDKFARIAQNVTLSLLVEHANQHLGDLKPRYRLVQGAGDLALHIVDGDMGDDVRSTHSLSGGERFLVSLSLALALSRMGGQGGLAATLFIDEGFGSLDAESLDTAMDALETLQAQGRTIGVISHVEAMKDRIPVQLRVTRRGAGASRLGFAGIG